MRVIIRYKNGTSKNYKYDIQEVEVSEIEKKKFHILTEVIDFDNIIRDSFIYDKREIKKFEFILFSPDEERNMSKDFSSNNGMALRIFYVDGKIEDVPTTFRRIVVCDWQKEKIFHVDTDFKANCRSEDFKFVFGEIRKLELWM